MISRGILVLVALAGCRIGFDARTQPDAGADASTDAADARVPLPPRFVQTDSTMNPGAATIGLALSADVTAGNLLLHMIDYVPGTTIQLASITDDKSNTYQVIGPFDGNGNIRHYLAWSIAATAGPTTVTATLTGAPSTFFDLRLHEYENVDPIAPIQATASATGTTTAVDGAQSAPVTTVAPNQLIFGAITFFGVGTGGTGFTIRSTFDGDVTEDMVAPTPGVYRAIGTSSGSSWTATVAAIRGR